MAQFLPLRSTQNRLLSALTEGSLEKLMQKSDKVSITQREVLYRPGKKIAHVYFIESGWVSMVATLAGGQQSGVGLTGSDGFLGLPLLCGVDSEFVEAVVQGPGLAWRMSAATFLEEIQQNIPLRSRLLQYAEAMRNQVIQTAICNGHHGLEQRLARWILMSHDCAAGAEIRATQELLGAMLCAHRPSVTLAANGLRQAGCIDYRGGVITIRNRASLERGVCECYGAIRQRFNTIFATRPSVNYLPVGTDRISKSGLTCV